MTPERRRRIRGLGLLSLLALCTAPSPAWAVDSVEQITDLSRVERIAEELEESPLYIHHSLRGRWSDDSQAALEERLGSAPLADLSVRVVVLPSVPEDETGGRPTLFLHALHEVSGHDGVYVAITEDRRVALAAFDSPVRLPDIEPQEFTSPHRVRVKEVLDLVEEAPHGPPSSTALVEDSPPERGDTVPRPRGDAERFWDAVAPPGVLIGLLVAVVRVLVHRPSRWRPLRESLRSWAALVERLTPSNDPYRARRAPNRPWRWWLRLTLRRELRHLHRLLERTPADHPELTRAVQAYDAAGLIARSPHLPPQAMVCAVVVARHGVQLVEHPDLPLLEPCHINPLHGAATERHRASLPRQRRLTWWVCARCATGPLDLRIRPFSPSLPIRSDRGITHYRHARDAWARATTDPEQAFWRVRRELEV